MIHKRLILKTFKFKSELYSNIQGNYIWVLVCKNSGSAAILPQNVLSTANKENCINLLNSIKSEEFFKSKTLNKAAVLVPLCKQNDKLALLYTVRALHLKVNGGEISFPGGRFDKSDGDLEKTALRETHEEVGIQPNQVEIWGRGPEIHRPDIRVTPILGYIGELNLHDLRVNHSEVSCAFLATLDDLSSTEHFRVTRFRFGQKYVFQSPVFLVSQKRIWGLTAYITHFILSSLIPEFYKKNVKFRPRIQRVLQNE